VNSSSGARPFYTTFWFGIVATIVMVAAILLVATSMPELGGRPTRGFGQLGVVLIAVYWVAVFPRLRKMPPR
jgi:hypothetical protein